MGALPSAGRAMHLGYSVAQLSRTKGHWGRGKGGVTSCVSLPIQKWSVDTDCPVVIAVLCCSHPQYINYVRTMLWPMIVSWLLAWCNNTCRYHMTGSCTWKMTAWQYCVFSAAVNIRWCSLGTSYSIFKCVCLCLYKFKVFKLLLFTLFVFWQFVSMNYFN